MKNIPFYKYKMHAHKNKPKRQTNDRKQTIQLAIFMQSILIVDFINNFFCFVLFRCRAHHNKDL